MKIDINPMEHASEIIQALQKGVLLTTKAGDKVNTMSISWGFLGIEFNKPIFIPVVRKSRYTLELLEQNPEFTINLPIGALNKSVIALCGTKSGRDMDKINAANLTLVEPQVVSVPAIREFPLTLECRAIFSQYQDGDAFPPEIRNTFFPIGSAEDGNYHKAFYGEIVAAYIIE